MELTVSHTTRQDTVSCEKNGSSMVIPLVREAIGERTNSQFCHESGISEGYFSRLLNGRLDSNPSVRTLAKIALAADPRLDTRSTFEKLLTMCGYNLGRGDIQRELRMVKRASEVTEAERKEANRGKYGSLELGASAIGLMFAKLIAMGANLQLMGATRPTDGVVFQIKGCHYDKVVAIPGFCGDSHQTVLAERDILRTIVKFVSAQTDLQLYLILTDHKDVFSFVSEVLVQTPNVTGYVLRANNDHSRFVEQRFCAAKETEEATMDFVK